MTEEGAQKAVLKQYAQQHFDLFLEKERNEDDLDRAHLLMKRHRRTLGSRRDLRLWTAVDAPEEHHRHEKHGDKKKKRNAGHQTESAKPLLSN
eukprot:s2038_g15.t1